MPGRRLARNLVMAKAQIVEPCQRMTRSEYRTWPEKQP
jgi:hypothetical protein